MTKINESFICEICGHHNPPADKTCRNHCQKCLFSKHLDQINPGDRLSTCHGPMEPISIDQSGKKGFIIHHRCLKCDHQINNKTTNDDNIDTIILISQRQIGEQKKIPHFVLRDQKKAKKRLSA